MPYVAKVYLQPYHCYNFQFPIDMFTNEQQKTHIQVAKSPNALKNTAVTTLFPILYSAFKHNRQ